MNLNTSTAVIRIQKLEAKNQYIDKNFKALFLNDPKFLEMDDEEIIKDITDDF